MNDTLLKLLQQVDTPTVCNAIEVAQGKRGFDAFTRGTMLASHPEAPAMVGYARTARIAAVAPPTEAPDVIKARRMAYYRHMAEGPRPAVAVIEDMDFPHCIGAYWGEINTTVHKGFGMSGALTTQSFFNNQVCLFFLFSFAVLLGYVDESTLWASIMSNGCNVFFFPNQVQIKGLLINFSKG